MLDLLCRSLVERGFEILDVSDDSLEIKRVGSQKSAIVNFSNLYRQLNRVAVSNHAETIDRFVTRISLGFGDFCVNEGPAIFPRILPHAVNNSLSAPWSRSLIPKELDLILVADHGQVMKQLTPMQIVSMGKPIIALLSEAMTNLSSITIETPTLEAGVLHVALGDGHDSARVLLADRLWPDMRYAAFPSRDSLWLSRPFPNEEAQQAVDSLFKQSAYPISPKWYLLSEFQFPKLG